MEFVFGGLRSEGALSPGRRWNEGHVEGRQKTCNLDNGHPRENNEVRKYLNSSNIDTWTYRSVRSRR